MQRKIKEASGNSRHVPRRSGKKLNEMAIDMYAHLQVFQQLETQIIDQHSCVQAKNVQFIAIQEGLNNMQRWIIENPDALPSYLMLHKGKRIDYASLDHANKLGRGMKRKQRSH
jgi:hypothetical protein